MRSSHAFIIGVSIVVGLAIHAFLGRYEIINRGADDGVEQLFRLNKATGEIDGFFVSPRNSKEFKLFDLYPMGGRLSSGE
jgi:hypothetical protein